MNKKLTMILRIILGLLLILFGVNKFAHFMSMPPMPEAASKFMGALIATGYMFKFLGIVELGSGLLILFNKWIGFALLILAPLLVNIILFHLMLAPSAIAPGAVITLLAIYQFYANWDKFKPLFE